MRHTTLRQLEVFNAIVRHGSFTRAAEELFLTQPTVSIQIKKLTDAVGLPLFEQIGKKPYLTDAGRSLYKFSCEIFDRFARFEMTIADMKGLKQGKLRLAAVTTAKYFIPLMLGKFCQQYPGVDVSLKVSNRERMLQRMSENEDDLYVFGQPPEGVPTVAEPFLQNPLVVVAPIDHPLSGRKTIPLEQLAEYPMLIREAGSGTRMAAERLFAAHGLIMKVRMELGSNEAIKQAVIGGLGIAVLSRHTLQLEFPGERLALLDVQGFPIERHWYLVYPEGKRLSVVAQAFRDDLLQHSADRLPRVHSSDSVVKVGRSPKSQGMLAPGDAAPEATEEDRA
jgi:DNA-binding transcriptional LysR family regulator